MIDPIDAGQRLFAAGRHDLAEKEFRRALAADPDQPVVHAQLALCLVNDRDRIDEALSEADEALRLWPECAFVHYVRGVAALNLGTAYWEEAEKSAREAVRLDPLEALFHGFLASILLFRCRWPESLAEAEEGLRLDPSDVYCLNLRAMALTRLNRKEEAARSLGHALANAPEDSFTHANQGWSRLHHGDHASAAIHFREALRLDPGNGMARFGNFMAGRKPSWFYRRSLGVLLWFTRQTGRPSPESNHPSRVVRKIRSLWVRSLMYIIFGLNIVIFSLVAVIVVNQLKEIGQASVPLKGSSIVFAGVVLAVLGNRAIVVFVRQFRPSRRFLLAPDERLEGNAVAGVCLTSFVAAVIAFTTDIRFFYFLMTYCGVMVMTLHPYFWIGLNRPGRPRVAYKTRVWRVLLTMFAVIATGAILTATVTAANSPSAWSLGILASLSTTWFPLFLLRLRCQASPQLKPTPPSSPSDPMASTTFDARP